MIFASSLFLFLFLPLTLAGYFLIGAKHLNLQNIFLLVMSLIFYTWGEPVYVFLMISSILMNYATGALIYLHRKKRINLLTEKSILIASIIANLGLLFYFKYANFFMSNLNIILDRLEIKPIVYSQISLPLGISFFTFHAISYVIDVYRQETEVQLNPIRCGLYLTLFPQLIAGPIVRYHDIAKQLVSRTVTRHQFSSGIQRFIFGLAKKTLLANPLGEVADKIFAVPVGDVTTAMAWLGIACYTLQIYFDFSGYSDMAIGLARLFGFEFLENFNYPYIAQSMREFWRRWHISLSNWFRDYLYIPLGGNRGSALRTYLNLWIVFLLCGLWHGASWNFAIWGALHGAYLAIERIGWQKYLDRLWLPLRHLYTLLLVMIAWVFFRSESLSHAIQYLASMLGITHADGIKYYALLYFDFKVLVLLIVGSILATPLAKWAGSQLQNRISQPKFSHFQSIVYAGYYLLTVSLFLLSASSLAAGTYNPFIYYRF
ncbi:MAG: MBOAT family protein [Pseudanabaena frigida]|uniref:MBOAT family protein n=1 Tax=Pseudanabaena frigida TaxID=945775 RepID=A0A2W4WFE0_9CYAN|nr:MAG: MBOAT family protein [Pseudanabaena frigida]